ncbi:hypothetical protein RF11_05780 [Thelohanellus kitauei]|uniref:Uncharacterized protein n=1 Tax=Thelohanellus kitauei TaxID=669202 RepID=A0A0C2NC12_THEKT|nr:hypothetical protein RF11_05780 [Thelohanellus kitauei]
MCISEIGNSNMNFQFNFVDEAESQLKEANIVSSMPIKWMHLLKKKGTKGLWKDHKDTDEYIIKKKECRKETLGTIMSPVPKKCDRIAEFYNDFETDIRRIKHKITDELWEDIWIENLLKSLAENQRMVVILNKPQWWFTLDMSDSRVFAAVDKRDKIDELCYVMKQLLRESKPRKAYKTTLRNQTTSIQER